MGFAGCPIIPAAARAASYQCSDSRTEGGCVPRQENPDLPVPAPDQRAPADPHRRPNSQRDQPGLHVFWQARVSSPDAGLVQAMAQFGASHDLA